MHTALRLGSVEYSGYLDLISGVHPSMSAMCGASENCRAEARRYAGLPSCVALLTGIGFRLAARLRHAGLEGYCPAPTYVIDGEERLLAALGMTARPIAEKRRKLWLQQLQRCNRM